MSHYTFVNLSICCKIWGFHSGQDSSSSGLW